MPGLWSARRGLLDGDPGVNEASRPGYLIEWWDGYHTRAIAVRVCGGCSAVVLDLAQHQTVCPGVKP